MEKRMEKSTDIFFCRVWYNQGENIFCGQYLSAASGAGPAPCFLLK